MKENISFEFIRFDNKMEANVYYAINLFSGDMLLINGFRNRANKKC